MKQDTLEWSNCVSGELLVKLFFDSLSRNPSLSALILKEICYFICTGGATPQIFGKLFVINGN